MLRVPITKIQILADKGTGHPLFYCHSDDRDHSPTLIIERHEDNVAIRARKALFKVKLNPQTKNRVDIYMSLAEARGLGRALISMADSDTPAEWRESKANPGAAAKGNMRLPTIIWSKYSRFVRAAARVRTGTRLDATGGYVNVDLEFPDDSHIKMKHYEVHLGIQLGLPTGTHDTDEAVPVHVPESELQRGRSEANPLRKTIGDFYLELAPDVAAGLGSLLEYIEAPQAVRVTGHD